MSVMLKAILELGQATQVCYPLPINIQVYNVQGMPFGKCNQLHRQRVVCVSLAHVNLFDL